MTPESSPVASALSTRPLLARAWRSAAERAGLRFVSQEQARQTDAPVALLVDVGRTPARDLVAMLKAPGTIVVALVDGEQATLDLRRLLAAGCQNVLTTHDAVEQMDGAMAAALTGTAFASDTALPVVYAAHRTGDGPEPRRPSAPLTERERQTLAGLVAGWTTKTTAQQLGLALKTVEGHRRTLFRKLGVRSATEAIMRALDEPGLLRGDDDAPSPLRA